MDSTIKIAHLPVDIAWADVERNLLNVAEKLSAIRRDVDILVLPELFSTGFIQDEQMLRQLARMSADMTLAAVKLWSSRSNMAIAGSYLDSIGNGYVNRGFFVEPSGETTFYDKSHLFCLSAESKVFTRGKELPPVIRFRGWNISLIVCYDLRFPVWCRNAGHRYDILLVPANWASARGYAWQHLLIARAIENQAVVVGANRSGIDDYGDYNGQSFIFDPYGKVLAPADSGTNDTSTDAPADGFIYADYMKSQLEKVRSYLPVGRDADRFDIITGDDD